MLTPDPTYTFRDTWCQFSTIEISRYNVECEGCGTDLTCDPYNEDIEDLDSPKAAGLAASNHDWIVSNGFNYCPTCAEDYDDEDES